MSQRIRLTVEYEVSDPTAFVALADAHRVLNGIEVDPTADVGYAFMELYGFQLSDFGEGMAGSGSPLQRGGLRLVSLISRDCVAVRD